MRVGGLALHDHAQDVGAHFRGVAVAWLDFPVPRKKFPVNFPVSREFGAETGSQLTASSGWQDSNLRVRYFGTGRLDGLKKFHRQEILRLYARMPRQRSRCLHDCSVPVTRGSAWFSKALGRWGVFRPYAAAVDAAAARNR
jgi:hypothetical protein